MPGAKSLNILHTVEFYHPSVGGMQEVVRQISERLVKLGHRVTVATSEVAQRKDGSLNGVEIRSFNVAGNAVRGITGDAQRYREFLLNADFDVITNFAAQVWPTDLALPLLDRLWPAKVFVPTGFSALHLRRYRGYFAQMGEFMKKYDMNVFLSDDYRDIEFARSRRVEKIMLIPNGAGADEFAPDHSVTFRKRHGIPEDHFLVLHVGSHTGVKGHAEAIRIFDRARIANATFLLVGNEAGIGCARACRMRERLLGLKEHFAKKGKRLMVKPLDRAETVAAYQQADLFLFPSNIECSPIVLFECMASKTPFLTTDVGNAAEILSWSGGGALLPTRINRAGFSKAKVADSSLLLEMLYRDKQARLRMAESGHAAWRERFTWEKIALDYEALYHEVAGGRE
ncbi:glycosyltransferase family 4 protein [Geomonas oryzae]|uniref:glycosyltransferase family 4 protein n=1 Tax=Geomonas oryzae TaxID=2364273 RepID=UPI00100A78F0|nr:glycosyltransferase family 4 protein [Geomonas oryzae]